MYLWLYMLMYLQEITLCCSVFITCSPALRWVMCGVCLSDYFSSLSLSTAATSCFTCRERDVCTRKKLDSIQQRSVSLSTSFMIKVTAPSSVCLSVCLSEEEARFYSAEICLALNFLHDKGHCSLCLSVCLSVCLHTHLNTSSTLKKKMNCVFFLHLRVLTSEGIWEAWRPSPKVIQEPLVVRDRVENTQEEFWQCTVSVCVAVVQCCGSWSKRVCEIWLSVCPVSPWVFL